MSETNPLPETQASPSASPLAKVAQAASFAANPVPLPGRAPLPLPLVFLVCFLGVDALERVVRLSIWALNRPDIPTLAPSPYHPNLPAEILWIFVHLLLAALILFRTFWGRAWTQTIFGIHLLYLAQRLVMSNPEIWVYLEWQGRARLFASVLFDAAVVCYLFSFQAREHLRR